MQICRRPMRPIIVPLTNTEVRRDPILGRDPWFENRGSISVVLNVRHMCQMRHAKGLSAARGKATTE